MKRILIVEDAKAISEILKEILESRRYDIITAENGREGVEMYKKIKPDLVITDISMPQKSGIELIKEIKEYNRGAKILVVSVISDKEVIDKAFAAGADDYIIKPFEFEDFLRRIEKISSKGGF